MKYLIFFFTLVFMFSIQSCKSQDIDSIIQKYSKSDFSKLKNTSIYRRSSGSESNTSRYFFNIFRGECSPYILDVTDVDHKIIRIDNDLVLESCNKDYFDNDTIQQLFNVYIEYNLCLLQIDNEGNVFINPDKADRPIFLRRFPNSTPKDLHLFKHYKDNWYIRK